MLWIWLTTLAAADCRLTSHEVQLNPGEGVWSRTDRWVYEVGTGRPDCGRLGLREAESIRISEVEAVVRHPDDSKTRLGIGRLHTAVLGPSERIRAVELPELRSRDRLDLVVTRTGGGGMPEHSEEWWSVASVSAPPGPAEPAALGPAQTELTLRLVFPEGEAPRVGPGSNGWTEAALLQTRELSAGALEYALVFPEEVEAGKCSAELDSGAEVQVSRGAWGCWVRAELSSPGQLLTRMSWTRAGVDAAGEVLRSGAHTMSLTAPDLEVVVDGGRQAADGFKAQQPGGESVVSWRVVQAGTTPVLLSRASVLSQVAAGALSASMPEPGLGLGFKDRDPDWEAVQDVLQLVRQQVVEGTLSSAHPLKPRGLTAVRRSRWGSPWEQALLLTRYLRQLKIDALPVPVRPVSSGRVEAAVPLGYTQAVVRVELDDRVAWLDPACAVCAVGELRPGLWGGQALSVGLHSLPVPLVSSGWVLQAEPTTGKTIYTLDLAAPWSTRLRLHLSRLPLAERRTGVVEWLGGVGTLSSHAGLSELGQPIRLVLGVQAAQTAEAEHALEARRLSP